jgi:hypothetical protein
MELIKGGLRLMSMPSISYTRTVKLQLQLQKSPIDRQFKGPIDCGRQVVRVQGIQGLWTGFTGSLAFRSNFFWMFLSFEVSADFNQYIRRCTLYMFI